MHHNYLTFLNKEVTHDLAGIIDTTSFGRKSALNIDGNEMICPWWRQIGIRGCFAGKLHGASLN
jgi:hypothetical protein